MRAQALSFLQQKEIFGRQPLFHSTMVVFFWAVDQDASVSFCGVCGRIDAKENIPIKSNSFRVSNFVV